MAAHRLNASRLETKLLHYMGVAIERFRLIQPGDRIIIGLSGGKDSLVLTYLLHRLQAKTQVPFTLKVVLVDQGWQAASLPSQQQSVHPNWQQLCNWLQAQHYDYHVEPTNIAQIVLNKQSPITPSVSDPTESSSCNSKNTASSQNKPRNRIPCMLCSRMRRGVLYRLARSWGFNKLALGHHRDDLITSLLMSLCYGGHISSMPPKLLNQQRDVILIRPLVYCQEQDIAQLVTMLDLPIYPSGCPVDKTGSARYQMGQWIAQLAAHNAKIPSNILHALENVQFSQLMDRRQFDFAHLENLLAAERSDDYDA